MRILTFLSCALIFAFLAMPAMATECANAGTAPSVAPDDTDDGNATACGRSAVAGGSASMALGYFASSAGGSSVALGNEASSAGEVSTALGFEASSVGLYSTALGTGALSSGNYSTALGWSATTTGNFSSAVGPGAASIGVSSSALGTGAQSGGDRSTALGYTAWADQPDTIILGGIPGVNMASSYANVGMGTSSPSQAVDVERSGAAARFQLTSFTENAAEAPQYIQRRARGIRIAPSAVQNGDNLGLFSFRGHNGTTMGGSRATITAQAAGNFTDTSTPTSLIFATTPVGQTVPQQVLVITPDGEVQVNGVNLNVPDYVFEEDYQLMPLSELKAFIDRNGHLPGIASAQQVASDGLKLASSQMGLLQKVEELTLYTLQQEARLKELQVKADKVDRLEELVNLLIQERDKS